MDRLGIKFLVIALDKKTDEYMKQMNVTSIFYSGIDKVEEQYAEFRTKQFNIITNRKMDAVLRILELGYDVVFSDVDVVVIRDPMPFFSLSEVDYMHSHNLICPRFTHYFIYSMNDTIF